MKEKELSNESKLQRERMTFNLDSPPGFRGLQPDVPVTRYERHLPHWRQPGATYFVTFHLADALPAAKQSELASMKREWEAKYPPPRSEETWTAYAKAVFQLVEKCMDAGFGRCWFARQPYADELRRALLHYHGAHYEIGCFVIMANHCHLAVRPFDGYELENIFGAVKRVTARFINEREGLSGELWQQESYDRFIRDAEHLYQVVQYIGRNPKNAGIAKENWNRWISPNWQHAGWNFHND